MINALKHAFPKGAKAGRIVVAYEGSGPEWKLSIADNGVGKLSKDCAVTKPGLGTSIVSALAEQLGAQASVVSGPRHDDFRRAHNIAAIGDHRATFPLTKRQPSTSDARVGTFRHSE